MCLTSELVGVTEQAAIAAAGMAGCGEAKEADRVASEAMRVAFNKADLWGMVVMGEMEKDESFGLHIGEKVGRAQWPFPGAHLDIAVDPLECTDNTASGRTDAISVLAAAPRGMILEGIDTYMEKIAVGGRARFAVDPNAPLAQNIENTARVLGKPVDIFVVAVLDRPRHKELIAAIRATGARVSLFNDGDVMKCVETCLPDSPVDMYVGTGGSTEGVLAAAAFKFYGGQIYCRWKPKDQSQVERLQVLGQTDLGKWLTTDDMVRGDDVIFVATGVRDGFLLKGVQLTDFSIKTHSLVLDRKSRSSRMILTEHDRYPGTNK